MHPAFLPCSFGQMVTTAPAGLTIAPSGLIIGAGRSQHQHRHGYRKPAAGAAIMITFVWAVS